ncbi:sodium:solute symporter family protein [Tunturibacter psychrotolerans]|uniref:Sodium:solute symporter family protein n=1 Tax=Tunturiibacter psychrotolerans TaxID=3069686 RepID=A0AAU7ZRJ4_9BACT
MLSLASSFPVLGVQMTRLNPVDVLILLLYFALVIFIGFYVKGSTNTSEEFFLAGREMSAWVAGLSFVSANLGSLELMGWAGAAYQYGMLATHWYWIGAIPAMLFLGIVMMPFYYISKTHSVPGYLHLRFGEGARALSAVSFALMTILMSGVNMYAMAVVMQTVLGWNLTFSIWVGAGTVALYVMLGGLRSAIINEVLQFILIWAGAATIPILGLIEAHGWTNLKTQIATNIGNTNYTHLWNTLGGFKDNPMGVHWTGIVFGLGFVISFGYWTTDFLVVQRVLSANSLRSAKMAPVIGAAFKMAIPLIVILPGLIALGLHNADGSMVFHLVPGSVAKATGQHSYDDVLPLMLVRYCGPGLLGLGITALIAGFMSGMAGNISAFSTVWTYDLYSAFINKRASDRHYVAMGRWSTVIGMLVSIATAYLVMNAASIMDYVQALFSFFIAPLFGTVILGMLWKRATRAGGFWGLLAGTTASIGMFVWVRLNADGLRYIAMSPDARPMAENLYRALWSWLICVVVTVTVSLMTNAVPTAQLAGLVYGVTPLPSDGAEKLWQKPAFWAVVVIVVFFILNIVFF